MNCLPAPLPTFAAPEGSKGGPPREAVAGAAVAVIGGSATERSDKEDDEPAPLAAAGVAGAADAAAPPAAADDAAGAADVAAEAPPPKPQPCFPCWKAAPGPEQIPMGLAQQPLPQSASETHPPVINCLPWPLPTLAAPLGSGVRAAAKETRETMVVAITTDFIIVVRVGRVCLD